MPMLIWVAALTGLGHKGDVPVEGLRHDPAELESRIEQQRKEAFGPKRYDEIVALEKATREAELKAAALKKEQDRLSAIAAVEAARQVAREARESASYDADRHIQLLQLRHALESFSSAKSAAAKMNMAHLIELSAISARHSFDDEEEAIALLLLH